MRFKGKGFLVRKEGDSPASSNGVKNRAPISHPGLVICGVSLENLVSEIKCFKN